MKSWELMDHTADLRIKARADTLGGLFEAAAEGLLKSIFNEAELSETVEKISFSVSAESREEALVKFLNELLYMFYVRKRLLKKTFCCIKFNAGILSVEAGFCGVKRFSSNLEIKSVTYGGVKIVKNNNLFEVAVIADV